MADPQIRAIVRGLEKFTERAVIKITLDTTANLIETTPVDTGWARANWVPAITQSFDRDLGGVEPTSQGATAAAQQQQAAIGRVVTGYTLARGRVFVTNNVPYIVSLNDGSSTKAPSGFVQNAIEKAVTLDIRGLRA